jgi:hypothetical protein
MAYATAEQLAEALETRATPDNMSLLNDCLNAAALEIDHFLGRTPIVDPPLALLSRGVSREPARGARQARSGARPDRAGRP